MTDGSSTDRSSLVAIALGALDHQTRFDIDLPDKFKGVHSVPVFGGAMNLNLADFTSTDLARTFHESALLHLADKSIPEDVRMAAFGAVVGSVQERGAFDEEINKWDERTVDCNKWLDRFLDLAKEAGHAAIFCANEKAECMAAKRRAKMMAHSMGEMIKFDKTTTTMLSDFETKFSDFETKYATLKQEKDEEKVAFLEQIDALKKENARLQARDDKVGGKMDYLRRMLNVEKYDSAA